MPPTPQPEKDEAHQRLLDQMDTYYTAKPFRSPAWKPSSRRNKNIKQIISEANRKEASVLATQNNSGASTPAPQSEGAMTPQPNIAQASRSLATLVLERDMQQSSSMINGNGTSQTSGPSVTYNNIESAPSLNVKKHYCDITGLPAKYTDPKTKLRYHNQEIFGIISQRQGGSIGLPVHAAAKLDYFNRIKGAIDNRIAEEQARAKQQQQQQPRPSTRNRPLASTGASSRVSSRRRDPSGTSETNASAPDPGQFDPEAVVGGDETPQRQNTPRPQNDGSAGAEKSPSTQTQELASREEGQAETGNDNESTSQKPLSTEPMQDLPIEVKARLRRLDKLESKYGELLRAYRAAHTRVQAIEPFEAVLRENTPLTSISDPSALSEYLTQITTKSGMVLDELKRVSTERDTYQKKSQELERRVQALEEENKNDGQKESATPEQNTGDKKIAPSDVVASDTNQEATVESTQDLFDFDSEVPRLQSELSDKQDQVEKLSNQIESLRRDLKVARESTEGMVSTLETTTEELNSLREAKEKFEETEKSLLSKIELLEKQPAQHVENASHHVELDAARKELQELRSELATVTDHKQMLEKQTTEQRGRADMLQEKLEQKDHLVKDLEDSLAAAKLAEREHDRLSKEVLLNDKRSKTMEGIMNQLRSQLAAAEAEITELKIDLMEQQADFVEHPASQVYSKLGFSETDMPNIGALSRENLIKRITAGPANSNTIDSTIEQSQGSEAAKKKNKRKKKGKNVPAVDTVSEESGTVATEDVKPVDDGNNETIVKNFHVALGSLQGVYDEAHRQLEEKTAALDKLQAQIKDQETLQEEIETLRDDLLHQGEEHVEARDHLKKALAQQKLLEEEKQRVVEELEQVRKALSEAQEMVNKHSVLTKELKDLRNVKQDLDELQALKSDLEMNLATAEQLAASRFKDITDLKELLNKAQPELRQLRKEVEELQDVKDLLKNKTGELNRLETKHEEVKAELKNLAKRLSVQDNEAKDLNKKIEQETKARERVEGELATSQTELRNMESRHHDSAELADTRSQDLEKVRQEANQYRTRLRDLDDQLRTQQNQLNSLREELSLKTSLHASSQTLTQSLRDQLHEITTQSRESAARSESLEEELGEAQRMLSERTRESQTMRMLLTQAETGTESRLREMKERMEAAIEERDRLEDEIGVNSRRTTREVEEAKSKAKEAQRQVRLLEEEKDDLENKNREWRRQREELEQTAKKAQQDMETTQSALKSLREALDDSERQIREADTQKAELRRQTDDATERIEKLSKANKNLTEELKALQQQLGPRRPRPGPDSGRESSRTSIDSTTNAIRSPILPSPARMNSITSTSRSELGSQNGGAGLSQGTVDYVYLKSVLLQFLSQKDKKHQRQLVPVLGMLLHFDGKDERDWNAAIAAR